MSTVSDLSLDQSLTLSNSLRQKMTHFEDAILTPRMCHWELSGFFYLKQNFKNQIISLEVGLVSVSCCLDGRCWGRKVLTNIFVGFKVYL